MRARSSSVRCLAVAAAVVLGGHVLPAQAVDTMGRTTAPVEQRDNDGFPWGLLGLLGLAGLIPRKRETVVERDPKFGSSTGPTSTRL